MMQIFIESGPKMGIVLRAVRRRRGSGSTILAAGLTAGVAGNSFRPRNTEADGGGRQCDEGAGRSALRLGARYPAAGRGRAGALRAQGGSERPRPGAAGSHEPRRAAEGLIPAWRAPHEVVGLSQ